MEKNKKFTIADLPKEAGLLNVHFKYPKDGKWYYWKSQWSQGVWGRTDKLTTRVVPLFVNDLKEVFEWECEDPNDNSKEA